MSSIDNIKKKIFFKKRKEGMKEGREGAGRRKEGRKEGREGEKRDEGREGRKGQAIRNLSREGTV